MKSLAALGKVANLMRFLVVPFLVWSFLAPVHGAESRSRTPPWIIGGQHYSALRSWAESNHLTFTCTKKEREEEILLSGRGSKLLFKANSQRAEINGIILFLAFPIVVQQGTVWVAQKDLERTLDPILFPAKSQAHQGLRTVAVSAGHGGKDSGYLVSAQAEKKYTLLLAKEVQQMATRAGLKAFLIRGSDTLIEYEDRTRMAKRGKADVFVELHYNSAGAVNSEIRGAEVYCLTPAGASSTNGGSDQYGGDLPGNRQDERNILLAYQIHRSLVQRAGLLDRGVRRARFVVLRDAEMPAVLVEAGFMSHPEELRGIQDTVRRRKTAQAIVEGLLAYKRQIERQNR